MATTRATQGYRTLAIGIRVRGLVPYLRDDEQCPKTSFLFLFFCESDHIDLTTKERIMSLVSVSTGFANSTSPGYKDNPERWVAARITASHINVMLGLIKRSTGETLTGDEFESAKCLMVTLQAAAGVFVDALHTATTVDQLIDINQEFYNMACAKS